MQISFGHHQKNQTIESILKSFTKLIAQLKNCGYAKRLTKLNILSLEDSRCFADFWSIKQYQTADYNLGIV